MSARLVRMRRVGRVDVVEAVHLEHVVGAYVGAGATSGAAVQEARQDVALRVAFLRHLEHARHADGYAEPASLAALERHDDGAARRVRRVVRRGGHVRTLSVTNCRPASSAARSACNAAARWAGTSCET